MITPIAHLRTPKAWLQAVAVAMLLLVAPYLIFFFHGGHFMDELSRPPHAGFLPGLFWVAMLAEIPVAFFFISTLKLLFFEDGRVVWIENGAVIWIRRSLFAAACVDIVRVAPGIRKDGMARLQGVTFMRDGSEVTFPTGAFRESREAIIARLNELLHLVD